MATEKTATQPTHGAAIAPNGGDSAVTLGPRDSLKGRLELHGDLKVQGVVEGELKISGDLTVDAGSTVSASLEAGNVNVRGQVTGNVTARRRLTLGGAGRLTGDVKVGRLTIEDGAILNGNVSMTGDKTDGKG